MSNMTGYYEISIRRDIDSSLTIDSSVLRPFFYRANIRKGTLSLFHHPKSEQAERRRRGPYRSIFFSLSLLQKGERGGGAASTERERARPKEEGPNPFAEKRENLFLLLLPKASILFPLSLPKREPFAACEEARYTPRQTQQHQPPPPPAKPKERKPARERERGEGPPQQASTSQSTTATASQSSVEEGRREEGT